MSDDELIARLTEAAVNAIEHERPGICYDRARLRGIVVELSVANNGGVITGDVYIQRRASVSRLLGKMPPMPGEGAA